MKMQVIVDSAGNVIGAAQPATHAAASVATKGTKAPAIEAGIGPSPGQSVHEVEVPEDIAQLEGTELLKRLSSESNVRKALKTLVTAGQA